MNMNKEQIHKLLGQPGKVMIAVAHRGLVWKSGRDVVMAWYSGHLFQSGDEIISCERTEELKALGYGQVHLRYGPGPDDVVFINLK
jgi:hypothetical protein